MCPNFSSIGYLMNTFKVKMSLELQGHYFNTLSLVKRRVIFNSIEIFHFKQYLYGCFRGEGKKY